MADPRMLQLSQFTACHNGRQQLSGCVRMEQIHLNTHGQFAFSAVFSVFFRTIFSIK
jgi:hypothetical protein